MFGLNSKIALVTGAGIAIAQLFAEQGATLWVVDRDAAAGRAVTAAIANAGGLAEFAAASLYLATDESAMITGSNLLLDGGWSAGK